jgi:hypothetical protein
VSNVYPGLDSPELEAAIAAVGAQIDALDRLIDAAPALDAPAPALAAQVAAAVDQVNAAVDLAETIRSYIAAFVTTDSRNALAMKPAFRVRAGARASSSRWQMRFQAWVGRLGLTAGALDPASSGQPGPRLCACARWQSRHNI